jgi:hypothetical protein
MGIKGLVLDGNTPTDNSGELLRLASGFAAGLLPAGVTLRRGR